MKVLIVDQFAPVPSPYDLSVHPMKFEDLIDLVMGMKMPNYIFNKPEVKVIVDPEGYWPPYATTVYRANGDGNAEMWKCRWDSSG